MSIHFLSIIYTSNKTYNHAKERMAKQSLGVENSKVHTKHLHTHINNKHHKIKFHPHIYDHQAPPPKKVLPSSTTSTTNTNTITSELNLTPLPKIAKHQTFLCNCQHNKLKTLNLTF